MAILKRSTGYFLEPLDYEENKPPRSRLQIAAQIGKLETVAENLKKDARFSKEELMDRDDDMVSPLEYAITTGQFSLLTSLLDPADPFTKDDLTDPKGAGHSPLSLALKHDRLEILTDYLGDDRPFEPQDFLREGEHGFVALIDATKTNLPKVANHLKEGSSFTREDITTTRGLLFEHSVLGYAAYRGTVKELAAIIPEEERPLADDFLRTGGGITHETLLNNAIAQGHLASLPSILKEGESLQERHFLFKEGDKFPAIRSAAKRGCLGDVQEVLGKIAMRRLIETKTESISVLYDMGTTKFKETVKADIFSMKALNAFWDKAPETFKRDNSNKKIYLEESKRLRQKTASDIAPPSILRKRER